MFQIPCGTLYTPPMGCVQYHMDNFGNFKSFNFGLDDNYHSLGNQVMIIVTMIVIVIMIMITRTTPSASGGTRRCAGISHRLTGYWFLIGPE